MRIAKHALLLGLILSAIVTASAPAVAAGCSLNSNSYVIFTQTVFGFAFPSSFTYWTDPVNPADPAFNLITADGKNAPAPWVGLSCLRPSRLFAAEICTAEKLWPGSLAWLSDELLHAINHN